MTWPNVYVCLSQETRYDGRRDEVRPDGLIGGMVRPWTTWSPVPVVVIAVAAVAADGAEDELVMISAGRWNVLLFVTMGE